MPEQKRGRSNRWLTTLTVDPKLSGVTVLEIIGALSEENIESRPVWKPMHLQPVFEGARFYEHDGDVSRRLFENGLCLPSGSSLREEDQELTIRTIRRRFKA
jgi:pyridoxal phosphate-dependent aminotransferase EpsN